MGKAGKVIVSALLLLLIGGSYWLGRVQGGRVGPGKSAATNLVQSVVIDATQKTSSGALYGDFEVVVKVKNTTKRTLSSLKVVCDQVSALPQNPTSVPKVVSKMLVLASIPAGQTRELRFKGFKVQHPEQQQELVVNIVGYGGLGKLPYKAVFPPNSKD